MFVAHFPLLSRITVSLLTLCGAMAAPSVRAGQDPIMVVGESIGNDFSIDLSFGTGGYTIVNYNDADGTDDEGLRITAADDGGYWLIGMHAPDSGGQKVAISKLDANGVVETSFGNGGKIAVATDVTLIQNSHGWIRETSVGGELR